MDAHANKFWEGFSPEGKERLLHSMALEGYPDRGFLFHEGDPADGVCMVLSGEVEVLRKVGSHEQILGRFVEGEFLGEVAVLDGGGRSSCARAHGPVTVGKIPKDLLLEALLKESPSVSLHLFQQLLSYLRRTNDLFVGEMLNKEKLSVVGEMASSLMHDLRNPLAGIRISSDLISVEEAENPRIARYCDGIRFQCDRVMAMTRDLFEFTKGCLRLLQNLVTNAVEALKGKTEGKIQVRGWVEDSMFNLSISDNGPGIPEAIRDRVFQPFVTHGKKGGIGLGMAIVNNVVTAHHGSVKLETSEKGTHFLAQLPQFAVQGSNGAIPEAAPIAVETPTLALIVE